MAYEWVSDAGSLEATIVMKISLVFIFIVFCDIHE